jgi:hypothetical protein
MTERNITVHFFILSSEKNLLYFFFWKNVSCYRMESQLSFASEELTAKFRSHQQYISYSTNAPANMLLPNIWKYLILKRTRKQWKIKGYF